MQANYSEAELLTVISKFRKRKKIRRRSFKPSKKHETRHFHVVVLHWQQRNVQKRHATRVELLFCLFNLLLFWRCDIFKSDVTRDNLQRRVLAQHRVQMLEQCCSLSKRCRNNVISYLEPSVGASGHQSTFTFNGTFVRDKIQWFLYLIVRSSTYSSVPSKVSRVINVSAVP